MSGSTRFQSSSTDTTTARAVREDVDLERTVWFGGGEAYHRHASWGPACPDQVGRTEEKTLGEAAENGLRPCKQCQPVDYRPLATDGGIALCWDHEDCPRDDCDGELQQQDRFNVMCLACERVWTHWKDDEHHHLVTADDETVASKPRVATDGGWPSGDPCPECGELMDVGAVGNPGETITWQECEDCGIGWGPFTGFVDTDQEDDVATDGGVEGWGEPWSVSRSRELVEEARDAAADLDDVHRARLDLVLAGLDDVDGPGGLLDEIAYHLDTLSRHVDDVDVTHPVRNALQLLDAVRTGDRR